MGIWLWLYKLGEASIRSTKLKHVKKWLEERCERLSRQDQDDERRLEDKVSWVEVSHNTPAHTRSLMNGLSSWRHWFRAISSLSLASPPLPPPYISRGDPRTKQSRLLRPRPPPVDPNTLEEDLITTSPFEREIWFSLVGVDTLLFGKKLVHLYRM